MQALSIQQLRKQYKNGFEAVRGIDLTVEPGDFFALLGPNGAGKSTTIGIICGLINKTSGAVQVFGHDIDRAPDAAKRQLGLVPQEFNFNVFEPIRDVVINQAGYYGIGRVKAKARTEHYLRQLGLWDKRGASAQELSGGMKRRLMIARALVHEPQVLILDEPTAGVDIEIRRAMWTFLQTINKEAGITIILTTHYLEEAESLCNNVAIINQGKIVEQGRVSELLGRASAETFVLDVSTPITGALTIPDYRVSVLSDQQLEIEVARGQGLNALFESLSAANVQVDSLRNKTNRLEEFFIRLVKEKP